MQTFNNFQELMANATVGGQTQSELVENAAFIGEPDQWNHFDAEQKKEGIEIIESLIYDMKERLNKRNNATTIEERQKNQEEINAILRKFIITHGDCYVDLKKQLLELGVTALSDVRELDEYYKQKHGDS